MYQTQAVRKPTTWVVPAQQLTIIMEMVFRMEAESTRVSISQAIARYIKTLKKEQPMIEFLQDLIYDKETFVVSIVVTAIFMGTIWVYTKNKSVN